MGLAVLTQYRRVTASQPASHLSIASTALASVAQVKMRIIWQAVFSTVTDRF